MSWHQEYTLVESLSFLRAISQSTACITGSGPLQKRLQEKVRTLLAQPNLELPISEATTCPITDNAHYILVDNNANATADTLVARGVVPKRIAHADRILAIVPEQAFNADETRDIWLEITNSTNYDLLSSVFNYNLANHFHDRVFHWLKRLLTLSQHPANTLGELILRFAQRPYFLSDHTTLDSLLKIAQPQRDQLMESSQRTPPRQILLYPSAGRCGGNSIHYALESAQPKSLRGGHEVFHVEIYQLLQLQLTQPQTACLTDLALYHIIQTHDALGGNPSCFLLDQILALPHFQFTLLSITRNRNDHLKSILERNFHYTPDDTVLNRVTATDYGEMSINQWKALSRSRKIEWYLDKAQNAIDAYSNHQRFIRVELNNLEAGLTQALQTANFDVSIKIHHLNTSPTYREFSHQELPILYQHFQAQELHKQSPETIEKLLAENAQDNRMKRLTVCILTYKRAEFLKIAIGKILEQSFSDFDLIIVDDCSPDNTKEVVENFRDPRITYVRNEKNLGFNANYNKAISLALSPYILLTHDDDEMTPTFLEREVAALDAHPDVAMVATNTESIDQQSARLLEREIPISDDILYQPGEYIEDCLGRGIGLCCPTYMFRKSFLEDTGISFRAIGPGSDIVICMETNINHSIYLIADPIFRFRAHDGQDHVQLKNCMRADLIKDVNIWRILKSAPNVSNYLPQIGYNMANAFPLHIVADTIQTDNESISLRRAFTQLLDKLNEDEKQIVRTSPKFRLLEKNIVTSTPSPLSEKAPETKANNHLAALLQHNDRLLESWIRSETSITKLLSDRGIKTVALWGVGVIAIAVHQELERSGIQTLTIIDNDPRKSGHQFLGMSIEPFSATAIPDEVSAVITCIESYHDLFIRQQIAESEIQNELSVYSWKELAIAQSPDASRVS